MAVLITFLPFDWYFTEEWTLQFCCAYHVNLKSKNPILFCSCSHFILWWNCCTQKKNITS